MAIDNKRDSVKSPKKSGKPKIKVSFNTRPKSVNVNGNN